jgi:anti-sigma-K factor RskA
MTQAEENGPERDGDDMLAAEYVLGVLPLEERQIVGHRIETEAEFARLVDTWEARLSPLAAGYARVEPPASVKEAIDRRLFTPAREAPRPGPWASLAFWRGLAAAAFAALAILTALPYLAPPAEQQRLVASLTAEGSDVKYLALYDAARREIALSHVSGERASGKDFELWMIEGKNAPVSLGIIPPGAAADMKVPPGAQQKLAAGAVLAVSVEPAGGSTTGQPTGPVVAAGDLKSI